MPFSPSKIVLASGFHIEVKKDDGVRNMSKEEIDSGLLATVAREVVFENKVSPAIPCTRRECLVV